MELYSSVVYCCEETLGPQQLLEGRRLQGALKAEVEACKEMGERKDRGWYSHFVLPFSLCEWLSRKSWPKG